MGTLRRGSLADALFPKTKQRVLGLLFANSNRSFYLREVIARTATGSGAARRELERLTNSGLVVMTRVGNQTHYHANRNSPVFAELRHIALKTIGLGEPLREALSCLGDRIRLALVYGSIAKGEDRARSDVDLLVVADDVILEEIFGCLMPVEVMLGRPIHPTLYTTDEFQRHREQHDSFVDKTLTGGTILLIGRPGV